MSKIFFVTQGMFLIMNFLLALTLTDKIVEIISIKLLYNPTNFLSLLTVYLKESEVCKPQIYAYSTQTALIH